MSTELRIVRRLVVVATVIIASLLASISYSQDAKVNNLGALGGYPGSTEKVSEEVKNLAEIEGKLEGVLELLPQALPGEDVEIERQMLIEFYDRLTARVKGKTSSGRKSRSSAVNGIELEAHANLAAQEPAAPNRGGGRYQISAWSHAVSSGQSSMHGAYIIDSKTGRIWVVISDNAPHEIGTLK